MNPMVPGDVDLRDFAFMPFDVQRLLTSETWVLGTGDERSAAITLWLVSWHQVPAASLPDNERMLAHLSQAKSWPKVKGHAMRGWELCSDGRWYHPVVAEKALEAWLEKLAQRISSGAGNAKRWGIDFDSTAIEDQMAEARTLLMGLNPQSRTLSKKRTSGIPSGQKKASTGNPEVIPSGIPSGSQETGTGTGIYQEQKQEHAPHARSSQDPPASDATPTDAGRACLLMRQAGCAKVNPSHPELIAALAEGVTPEAIRDAYAAAPDVRNPFAYAIATARGLHADGARTIATGPPRRANDQPSRTRTALETLQARKRPDELPTRMAEERGPRRLVQAGDAEP